MTIPELLSRYFIKIQIVMFIVGVIVCFRILQGKETASKFRSREADRNDLNRLREGPDSAQAKLNRPKPEAPKAPALQLPGVRLVGEAHEILGVSENASEADVMKAYKESIKRFHPDRIQGQAKDQLQFYQEASARLNQAKEDMMKKIRTKS